jgi:hypothetical protein
MDLDAQLYQAHDKFLGGDYQGFFKLTCEHTALQLCPFNT